MAYIKDRKLMASHKRMMQRVKAAEKKDKPKPKPKLTQKQRIAKEKKDARYARQYIEGLEKGMGREPHKMTIELEQREVEQKGAPAVGRVMKGGRKLKKR
ncbi:MAG: hypothetical protein JXA43_03485 [Candidatus Diapherotrites archaeon]|nr:hypothetical protein [Candidatus Diapherotrites archaeon]